jgi:2-oxo-4-hydroxy-4-carboxy-5-ureidoimidazoline decarboxylase
MTALIPFNQLSAEQARALLAPCVAIPHWVEQLVAQRPYASRGALLDKARTLAAGWGEAELAQALSAHPRIGEKPQTTGGHAEFSRSEQSAVDDNDARLTQALKEDNARYEARFGRVFLIRAKGRSGEEILAALERRLNNGDAEELRETLAQLVEITLLRLEGVISE